MVQKRPFTPDPILTAIAIAFRNKNMIADELMMRTAPLSKEAFKYRVYNLEDGFTIPDTKVGRRGRVNEVEFSSEDVDSSTEDYGLEDPIPQSDLDNDNDGNRVISRSTEQIRNLIMLDREVRVSNIAFSAASYGANNSEVVAVGDRFDDNVNPIPMINDGLATPLMRPTCMTFGEKAWNKFSVNPFVVKAAHGNSGDAGIASVEAVRLLFRLDKLLIGQARVNTARKGQTANIQTAWGNSVSMTYQDVMADNRSGTTWGFTAQHGLPFAAQWFDKDIGLKGGQRVRVGESVKELVSAKDLGYLLENVTNA